MSKSTQSKLRGHLGQTCAIRKQIYPVVHIRLFIAILCQSSVYLQETLLWLFSMYMECNVSYVSLKYTKGKENLAAGPLSCALPGRLAMSSVALQLAAPAAVFSVEMHCP